MTKTVDQILDDGAKGLLYFEQLLPLYQEAFGTDLGWPLLKIQATYDQEREMNLAKMQASADALKAMITVADTQRGVQQTTANSLGASWQGAAAEAGIGRLREVVGFAEQDRNPVQTLANAMSDAVPTLRQIVEQKATTVLQIAAGYRERGGQTVITVKEMPADDIRRIIDASKTGDITDMLLNTLTDLDGIENRTEDVKRHSDEWKQAVKETCKEWLDEVFKQAYSDKLDVFRAQCNVAQTGIEGKFNYLQALADAIQERAYPSVAGVAAAPVEEPSKGDQSGAKGNQNSDGSSPGAAEGSQNSDDQTSAAGTQKGDTSSPVKTTTQDTDDDSDDDSSDTSTALSTLATTLSELGTTVSSALTGDLGSSLTSAVESVGTSVSEGIEQMTEQASSLLSGEHEASFQLGDTKVTIQAGAEGLSLTTTGADGQTNEYRLTLDENGVPVVTTESGSEGSTGDQGETGVLGTGAPESGTGQGTAGLEDAGSGAGGGADATTSETPDLTNAPVTSEVGAGDPSSGSVAGGVPVGPRSQQQETDGEHTSSVEDHQASNPGDSGAVLAEAGPL
ncbi:hypothetical protein [Nocardia ignorata]|uniref:Uncharacterized protein n=2 Tax=Actinomycetes TaxID=1760 RepID=A0A4R6PMV3_NOCIG|nr:hypothetical protein [Nocardia ignorata]TDP39847.1 hypothetical protein DFR75_102566 [Nocardia ignorata]